MKTIDKNLSAFTAAVLFFGCATLAAAGEYEDRRLADAREMMQRGEVGQAASSLERALPSLIESSDFRSTSRVYFQLALARGRQNDNRAACAALSKSLDYYRRALARYRLSPERPRDMAADGDEGGEGMQEIGAQFGCPGGWSAASNAGAKTR